MTLRQVLKCSVAASLMLQCGVYSARAAEPAAPVGAEAIDEVVVTGSRIVRDGYQAPTPLTVIDSAVLENTATSNFADQLNTMPVFSGSLTPSDGAGVPSFNTGGINSLDLRNLGENRTLILMDGQRSVSTLATGVVDINNFPQQLIERVDVVTGGASAVYGSDAVAGVVNIILDRDFTGVKGEVSGGLTTYGDAPNWKMSAAGGFPFANGRGHILLSGEAVRRYGVLSEGPARAWARTTTNYIVNPLYVAGNGQPEFVLRHQTGLSQGTKGGMITTGPLKGIAFGEGGVPYKFNYGEGVARDLLMNGGDYKAVQLNDATSLDPSDSRQNAFFRVSYDVTDNVNVWAQASWAAADTYSVAFPHYSAGTAGPLIQSGNPFIPASVQTQMTALGVTSFRLGTMNYEMPHVATGIVRAANRYVVGADGKFDAMETEWTWNTYVQLGRTRSSFNTYNVENTAKLALAVDAVRDPTTGAIVCRSTLTNPGNGCVPWNPMGLGVNDELAFAYLIGTAHSNQATAQDVYSGSITGNPFSSWAGPVSIALSAEHRKEHATLVSGPTELAAQWRSGNHQPLDAGYSVSEAAVEAVVPLAADQSFAEAWDLSLAFRGTDYQVSGYVSTWKVGTTWTPISDIRVRGTRSRDIRAPNISELFQSQNFGLASSLDPAPNTSNPNPTYVRLQAGSPTLTPEIADTTDIGVVFQPTFLPGFSASVDYWDIKMKDAITLISGANVLLLCYQGRTELCGNIVREATLPDGRLGTVTAVRQGNFNFASAAARGIDFEASYNMQMDSLFDEASGSIRIHTQGTRYIKNVTDDSLSPPNDTAGTYDLPKWVLTTTVSYSNEGFNTSLTARTFSSTVSDNDFIECMSGCPTSTTQAPTFDSALKAPAAAFFDFAASYGFPVGDTDMQVFFNVRNIMNKDPAIIPQRTPGLSSYIYSRADSGRYDRLGRVFRAGVRFRM
jgi:iron complex outermembrane recepter protein